LTNELVTPAAATANNAYRNFIEACWSPETRTIYTQGLHYYMDYLRIDRSAYDKLIPPGIDHKMTEMDIKEYIIYLRNKQTASATIATYVAALVKFYAMNHVILNWKWIKSFMGEHEKVAEDKPYTHPEIQSCYQILTEETEL
jgi:hypothetical protein